MRKRLTSKTVTYGVFLSLRRCNRAPPAAAITLSPSLLSGGRARLRSASGLMGASRSVVPIVAGASLWTGDRLSPPFARLTAVWRPKAEVVLHKEWFYCGWP